MRLADPAEEGSDRLDAAGAEYAKEAYMNMLDRRFDIADKTTFRNGMSRLGTSVNVVSTIAGGKRYGFTASAVCSVSDTPPTLLVCINRASSCFPAFENAGYFCVNTLMPSQEDIANAFGGLIPTEDRFSFGQRHEGMTGSPVLHGASVSFECELVSAVDQATHRVMFGRVIGIRENENRSALLYCMRDSVLGRGVNSEAH